MAVLLVIAALIIGYVLAAPFFLGGQEAGKFISTHDLIQHIAVMEDFDKALRSGVLYPRWLPDINKGYGIPWMNYYPPGFFYLASLVNAFVGDWTNTLFFISVAGFAASGLAFYLLAREFYGRAASALAALFYMTLPYHALNLYWQGAMPQFLGFTFLPLVLYFAYRTGAFGRAGDYAGLALCYGLYLITHAPVSLLMTYAIAFYGLVWAVRQRDWRILLRIGTGMIIGLMLGAVYLLPAALETKDIQEHFSGLFRYHSTYITLTPLEGFGGLLNQSFVLQALALLAAIVILRPKARSESEGPEAVAAPSSQTRVWVIMSVATTFMCTSFSIYISKLIPKIQVATFAWRWLAIAGLFTALLVAAAIDRLRDRSAFTPVKLWAWRAAIVAILVSSLWVTTRDIIQSALLHPGHNQPANYVEAGFTPAGSTEPESLPDTEQVVLQPEGGTSEIIRWEPSYREVVVNVKEPATVRLKTYNFPGWSARLDGEPVPLASDGDGVQLLQVPPGIHRLIITFGNTPPRTIGAILAGSALLIIAGLGTFSLLGRYKLRARASEDERIERGRASERVWASAGARRLALIGLAVAAIVFALFITIRLFRGEEKAAPIMGTGPQIGGIAIGGEAMLQIQGSDLIPVAVDDAALNELMRALPTRDQSKIDGLAQSGKVFRVPNGTRVRVLEFGSGKTKIRVIEGNSITMEGWVQERWIR